MQKVTPTPRTWTLRFKHQRATILLEVDPLQRFSDIRAELLHAIEETNPSGMLNGQEIPRNPDHIKLGRAVDRNNLSLGYTSIGKTLEEEGSSTRKGKGKSAVMAASNSEAGQLKDCPQGAGFRSGDVVAFKFQSYEEPEDEGESAEKWEVTVPTMEETYGAEDEGVGLEEEG
ncbi:Hypothetical predicted protein [Lecanosticta acicola]|uniref:Uncharacterized protein n=1 Tax=Lecanosticta acicola TaxID=111012 RepID=A0AAI8YWJ1_9PEZI|nr:Hypothetical predicted protein [Lecanosticta acicola]